MTKQVELPEKDWYDFLSRYENLLVQCGLIVSDEHLDYDKLAEVRKRMVDEVSQAQQEAVERERERISSEILNMKLRGDGKQYRPEKVRKLIKNHIVDVIVNEALQKEQE